MGSRFEAYGSCWMELGIHGFRGVIEEGESARGGMAENWKRKKRLDVRF